MAPRTRVRSARGDNLSSGTLAEQCACDHLVRHGLRLLERNYRSPFGEIDLVMEDNGSVVFVEVRFRRTTNFGSPAETVDHRKQAKLRATAEHYLQRHAGGGRSCRFDVVAVSGPPSDQRLHWLPNAFGV